MHYYRWRVNSDPSVTKPPRRGRRTPAFCTFEGCKEPTFAASLCGVHYKRKLRHGDPGVVVPLRRRRGEVWTRDQWIAAFESRLERRENGCLEFTGLLSMGTHGYGRIYFETRMQFAHRVAYEIANGPIPAGMNVCHHCDNPPCCDPNHLFLGDNSANHADMWSKGRGYVPTPARGEAHERAKVTEDQVREIRAANLGGENKSAIARRLGISRHIVVNICLRKTWKHVA